MKPASIKKFDLLYLGSIAVGLISVAINFNALVEITEAEMAASGVAGAGAISVIIGTAIWTLIILGLWFMVSRLRIEAVKYVLALLAAYQLLTLITSLGAGVSANGIIGILTTALSVLAIWFLFRPDAKAWFAEKKAAVDSE